MIERSGTLGRDERVVLSLWRRGDLDTLDIAKLIGKPEADVCRSLDAARDVERRLA